MAKTTLGKEWAAMLWQIMQVTGNGYRRHSLRHTGKKDDRRADKFDGRSKFMRSYQARYT